MIPHKISDKELRQRLNRKIRIISLFFLVGLLIAATAAVVFYFLNYQ